MAEANKPCCYDQSCGCVGYAYVPVQVLDKTYEPCTALERGSIFPELELTMCEYGNVCKSEGGTTNEM